MKSKHLAAIAIAAAFTVPAFAQSGSAGTSGSAGSAGNPAPASTSANVNANTGGQGAAAGQGQVSSGTGLGVSSGTGVAVQPSAVVSTAPSATATAPGVRMLPGAAMVQHSSTATMGGPGPGVSGSQTIVTQHWVNVPADVNQRGDFQRWMALK